MTLLLIRHKQLLEVRLNGETLAEFSRHGSQKADQFHKAISKSLTIAGIAHEAKVDMSWFQTKRIYNRKPKVLSRPCLQSPVLSRAPLHQDAPPR